MIIFLKRGICYLTLMLFLNAIFLMHFLIGSPAILALIALAVFYVRFNIVPRQGKNMGRRLHILIGGYELALAAIACFTLEILAYVYIYFLPNSLDNLEISRTTLMLNGLVSAILLLVLLANGIIRIFLCSWQLGIMLRICLLLFWWVPVANIILLKQFLTVSSAEYNFTVQAQQLRMERQGEELCKTKYPLLLVHGIFFRNWEAFSYWGRIPKELIHCGATIYYSDHQSSASVEQCAKEIAQCILNVIRETGCEKVNIIAHSKGGLDSRYAISCLGMGQYVASLTTICTPHRGCKYVGKFFDAIPHKIIAAIGKKYETLYTKLGDDNPDFFNGLKGLTDGECARLNEIMADDPHVFYQSAGTRMPSHTSAIFPMNLGYSMIKYSGGGENDGLVSTESMIWGDFLGILSPKGKQGISHADAVDLLQKNIDGFDVCTFYIDLVNRLKLRGF